MNLTGLNGRRDGSCHMAGAVSFEWHTDDGSKSPFLLHGPFILGFRQHGDDEPLQGIEEFGWSKHFDRSTG